MPSAAPHPPYLRRPLHSYLSWQILGVAPLKANPIFSLFAVLVDNCRVKAKAEGKPVDAEGVIDLRDCEGSLSVRSDAPSNPCG